MIERIETEPRYRLEISQGQLNYLFHVAGKSTIQDDVVAGFKEDDVRPLWSALLENAT